MPRPYRKLCRALAALAILGVVFAFQMAYLYSGRAISHPNGFAISLAFVTLCLLLAVLESKDRAREAFQYLLLSDADPGRAAQEF